MRKILLKVTLLCLALIGGVSADEQPVRVGVLASLTGNWAEIGRNLEQGVILATEEVNASGGVLNRKLRYDIQDTDEEKSGAKVVSAYRYLKNAGISFFVGPTGVPGIMALTPLVAKDDTILIAPTSTNSFYKDSHNFFNASGDNYITTKAAATRAYDRGFRKVAIFGSLQPWESDQANIFKREFTALGGNIVWEEYPSSDQTDLKMEALRIAKSNPEAVFFAIFNQVAIAAKDLARQGFKGGKFAAIIDNSHIAASGGALNGTELYLFNPPSNPFVEKFKGRFLKEPGIFADSAYDSVVSLAAAMNVAGTLEREKVIESLHKIKFVGSSGQMVNYDTDGLIARDMTLHEIVDGRLQKTDRSAINELRTNS